MSCMRPRAPVRETAVREAVAFRVDDGGEEFGVDVVGAASVGEEVAEFR